MEINRTISADEVISQLKDEGDFDRLRLKIIRKLKENEELRNNIISAIKQSSALNRPGAENLKPRQLSDAIHAEIGNEVMNQISDGVWEVIKSSDGMKNEIQETVESVYNRLLYPKAQEVDELPSHNHPMLCDNEALNNTSIAVSTGEQENVMSENEPDEPPGFTLCNEKAKNSEENIDGTELGRRRDCESPSQEPKEEHQQDEMLPNDDPSIPPGFAAIAEREQPFIDDEDPDVPPGFG